MGASFLYIFQLHRRQTLSRALSRTAIHCLLSFSLLCFGQTPHRSGPAAQQLKNWLAAYDDANWDVYRAFLKTNFAPDAANVFQDRTLRNQTGAFDLIKVEEETPTKVTALISEREFDKIGRIAVEVEPEISSAQSSINTAWNCAPTKTTSGFFANALHENRLLDARYTAMLTTGRKDMPNGGRYAYGFINRSTNESNCIGHNGGSPGMNGDLEICQGSAYVVIVLANMDPVAAGHIADFVVNRLPAPTTKK